jgi:hypothetical protein
MPNPTPPDAPPDGGGFYSAATALSRTPLGFLALCLVLVYAIAALVFAIRQNLEKDLAEPLVWFIVVYPVLVLVVFTVLVSFFRGNLLSSEEYLRLQELIRKNQKRLEVMAEMAPVAFDWQPEDEPDRAGATARVASADDPQKGKWGGKRRVDPYEVRAGKITPLKTDPDYFRIPLEVRRTDGKPLEGKVRFHLHDSFTPEVEEVEAEDGVAKLELVGYGAFTVGVELPDGTKLEIDLSDPGIDAPPEFKVR